MSFIKPPRKKKYCFGTDNHSSKIPVKTSRSDPGLTSKNISEIIDAREALTIHQRFCKEQRNSSISVQNTSDNISESESLKKNCRQRKASEDSQPLIDLSICLPTNIEEEEDVFRELIEKLEEPQRTKNLTKQTMLLQLFVSLSWKISKLIFKTMHILLCFSGSFYLIRCLQTLAYRESDLLLY